MASGHYAILAEFTEPEDLVSAVEQTRAQGYRKLDAFTPFPVHGLAEALALKSTKLPLLVFAGGVAGLMGGFGLQYWFNVIEYPMNIGGRAVDAWQPLFVITYECTILAAAISAVVGMLALNGYPRPHHPVFNARAFESASRDGFFLAVEADDPKFDVQQTVAFLRTLSPKSVTVVPLDKEVDPEPAA